MKKSLIFTCIIGLVTPVLKSQNRINTTGIQLDFGMNRGTYHDYVADSSNQDQTTMDYDINPQFRIKVAPQYNLAIGANISKYHSNTMYPGSVKSEYDIKESLIGPSVSITRYCDPCESEDDCIKYFTFLGFYGDMLSGKRTYERTYGNNSNFDHGKIRQIDLGLNGGVAYQVFPNIYLQGSVNILGYTTKKTIYENDKPDRFNRNSSLSLFRGARAGIIVPF
jgi:hypothetical protein